jgi:hypothetical protein
LAVGTIFVDLVDQGLQLQDDIGIGAAEGNADVRQPLGKFDGIDLGVFSTPATSHADVIGASAVAWDLFLRSTEDPRSRANQVDFHEADAAVDEVALFRAVHLTARCAGLVGGRGAGFAALTPCDYSPLAV